MYKQRTGQVDQDNQTDKKSIKISNLEASLKALEETKQERSLLNYHRYLTIWDAYEDKVQNHFMRKELAIVGKGKQTAKAKVSLENKLFKKQPKAIQEQFKVDDNNPNEEDPNQVVKRNIKTISLAQSMVQPRPDVNNKTMRLSEQMGATIDKIGDSIDTDNLEDLLPEK